LNQSIRTLIVDDKLPACKALKALLTMMPLIEVVGQATNGQEAVHQVKVLHPDVVLMDIQMPGMDGLDATRRIKSSWPEVRVVILTMYTTYLHEALAAGADGYLIKGCDRNILLESVLNTSINESQHEMFNKTVDVI
jgi:DNA-binding NarL/FixJ family response regulator